MYGAYLGWKDFTVLRALRGEDEGEDPGADEGEDVGDRGSARLWGAVVKRRFEVVIVGRRAHCWEIFMRHERHIDPSEGS